MARQRAPLDAAWRALLVKGCSDPKCRPCSARRRRRELALAGAVGGAVGAFLLAVFLLILEALK